MGISLFLRHCQSHPLVKVPLELVKDMTAEQFLLALRRFIARRGKLTQIILDNAPQFKLAKTAIDKAWKETISRHEVQSYTANQGIEWNFIVELAPWMGGFYERLVGTVKGALKKSIGKICLTEEKLETFLAEAEAALILVHLVTSVRTSVLDFRIQQRTS